MDLLFWHHDATGFLALTIGAWALTVVAALFAARLEEREAVAAARALVARARTANEPVAELRQRATASLRIV